VHQANLFQARKALECRRADRFRPTAEHCRQRRRQHRALAEEPGQACPGRHIEEGDDIERITHEAPTFIGDTIYSESTVLATREASQGDRGTVTVETRVSNQRGERVMTFRRTALVPKKNHATLGERAQPDPSGPGHPRPKRDG